MMDPSVTSMAPESLPFDRKRPLDWWFKEIVGA
jgi:hypothetical protein